MEFVLDRNEKILKKRKAAWLPAFSPFPTMFSKVLFLSVIQTRDCEAKTLVTRTFVLFLFKDHLL